MSRYDVQLREIGTAGQETLQNTKLVMVGAGGLGAAALPYLAGAGIGHITIIDHDIISASNLHRQTIYKDAQTGENKACVTAAYLQHLNPDIQVTAIAEKITSANAEKLCAGFDLILDGSDNFETKRLLNETAIRTQTPLISASVEHSKAMVAVFAGHEKTAPCYACLFPEDPLDACNCSEAGILGTAAGLAGLHHAHVTLLYLLGQSDIKPGFVLSADLQNFRTQVIRLDKNPDCAVCKQGKAETKPMTQTQAIPLIPPAQVRAEGRMIIDVRTPDEIAVDPIEGALHILLDTLPARYNELPTDKPLAFACAANIRSLRAAEFMRAMGYDNVCVMDRLI